MSRPIYLDAAATTPLDPRVADAMKTALDAKAGNPSSLHSFGRNARRAVEDARETVAAILGVHPREVVFTSGATEANNTAVAGLAARADPSRRRVVASPLEHPSVLAPLRRLESAGWTISWMPVRASGHVDPEAARELLGDDVALSVLMSVNNETGAIQPVAPWAASCATAGVPLHTDAVQAAGRLESILPDAVSTASWSGHKIHGPPGAGVLVVRDGTSVAPLLVGGAQERDRRAGTENVPAIVGFARALELAERERDERSRRISALDDRLTAGLTDLPVERNGAGPRTAAISSLRFDRPHGETLLLNFDLRGVALSMGSACSSGAVTPSHVLRAMGFASADCYASVRLSFSHVSREEDVDRFLAAAREIVDGAT